MVNFQLVVRKSQIGKLRFRLEVECLRKKVAIDKSYCSIKKFLASTNKIGSSDSSHPRFFHLLLLFPSASLLVSTQQVLGKGFVPLTITCVLDRKTG